MSSQPQRPSRSRLGWGLLATSLLCTWLVMLAGPSAAEPPLRGSAPLLRADLGLPAWAVTLLLAVAVIAGAVALWLGLSGRWRPSGRRLIAVGVLAATAYAVSPPIGSADPLSYAAYGRMAATGHNPWSTTPRSLAQTGDPVGRAVEPPWQDTPSVYGPLAAGEQWLAAVIGGTNVAGIVELLDVVGAVALAGAGVAVWWAARRPPGGITTQPTGALHASTHAAHQGDAARVAALLVANPLVLIPAVAGGHVDALVAAFTIGGVAVAVRAVGTRRRGQPTKSSGALLAAGVLSGLGADVKITGLLVVAGIAGGVAWDRMWSTGESEDNIPPGTWPAALGDAGLVVLGAALVLVPSYAVAGSPAFDQLRRASHLVSAATPWRPVVDLLQTALPRGAARTLVGALVVVLLVALAGALLRLLRGSTTGRTRGPAVGAAALLVGYVLAAAYALPWYDAVAWSALALTGTALAGAAVVDVALVVHTAVLTLAYLPGRAAVPLHGALHSVMDGVRAGAGPVVITALIVWLLALGYHRSVSGDTPGPVEARRILPASTRRETPRQERGTHQRP